MNTLARKLILGLLLSFLSPAPSMPEAPARPVSQSRPQAFHPSGLLRASSMISPRDPL